MDGRVLQVNISPGGVPKLPVERAWVGPLGLEGDRHEHDTVHGGPHRAVALLGIEAIERVRADGHLIGPGAVGENLTTSGIELASLPSGARLAVGDQLVLEIYSPANPCDVIRGVFRDGKSGRISILTYPADSRMYARTVVEGEVKTGDPIRVLPPLPDATASTELLLERIDAVALDFNVELWRAVAAAGFDVEVAVDGELAMASSATLPSSAFNRAFGHRMLPHLLDRMLAFFARTGRPGWILAADAPWPAAVAERRGVILVADTADVTSEAPPNDAGAVIREIDAGNADTWSQVLLEASDIQGPEAVAWTQATRALVGRHGRHHLIAELDGQPVGVGGLFTRRRVGYLATAAVLPSARGRGLQRALIEARIRIAAERRCTVVAASAVADSVSEANLVRMGFRRIHEYALYRVDGAG